MKKKLSKKPEDVSVEESKEFFYEVALYKMIDNRVESIGGKFFRTTSPYKGKTCIVKKLDKNTIIMKTITELKNGNN